MRYGMLAVLGLAVAPAACSTGAQSGAEPGPAAEKAPPTYTTMLLLKDQAKFQRGDTVIVDFANITKDARIPYYVAGTWFGTFPLDAIGPAAAGKMIVTAERLAVRHCRSTGCSIDGYLSRGDTVEVNDFAGRWYRRLENGQPAGYVNSEHLILPAAYTLGAVAAVRQRIESYYDRELSNLTVDGSGVFSGYDVKLDGDELSIEIYTPFRQGPGLRAVCDAARGIVQLVQTTMANTPRGIFSAYSFGVYYNAPGMPRSTDVMVAGPAAGGGVYCETPG